MLLVAASAFIARCLYWALVTPSWVPDSDADQYVLLARALVDGDGYSLVYPQLAMHATAFRPPLYPLTLVPAAFVTHGLWAARLTSVLLGTAVVALVYVMARRIAGRAAGLAAGAVAAVYPPLLANDTVTLSEPLSLLLLLAAVLLVDDRRWTWAGVACGALMLTRPNAYLVLLTVAVVAFAKAGWRPATRLFVTAALVTVPWIIRNEIQVGTPDLVTSDGFTLAAVFAEPAQKRQDFVDPVFDSAYDDDLDLRLSQFDESVWSNKLLHRAWDGVRSNPRYIVTNARRNVAALLELSNNDGPERLDGRNIDFRHATLPLFYVVTITGIAGLWLHGRDWRVRLLAVLAAEFAALMILILAPPRLRAPIDVICCIGVGLAVASLRSRHRERHRPDPDRVPVAAQNVSLAATRVSPPDRPDGAFAVAVT
jgi:4-amino-4-deoxy-L-arabinose transferase-like glycosyltransferase